MHGVKTRLWEHHVGWRHQLGQPTQVSSGLTVPKKAGNVPNSLYHLLHIHTA